MTELTIIMLIAVILLGLTLVALGYVIFLLAFENRERRHRYESYSMGGDDDIARSFIAYGFLVEIALGLCFGVTGLYLMYGAIMLIGVEI